MIFSKDQILRKDFVVVEDCCTFVSYFVRLIILWGISRILLAVFYCSYTVLYFFKFFKPFTFPPFVFSARNMACIPLSHPAPRGRTYIHRHPELRSLRSLARGYQHIAPMGRCPRLPSDTYLTACGSTDRSRHTGLPLLITHRSSLISNDTARAPLTP